MLVVKCGNVSEYDRWVERKSYERHILFPPPHPTNTQTTFLPCQAYPWPALPRCSRPCQRDGSSHLARGGGGGGGCGGGGDGGCGVSEGRETRTPTHSLAPSRLTHTPVGLALRCLSSLVASPCAPRICPRAPALCYPLRLPRVCPGMPSPSCVVCGEFRVVCGMVNARQGHPPLL